MSSLLCIALFILTSYDENKKQHQENPNKDAAF